MQQMAWSSLVAGARLPAFALRTCSLRNAVPQLRQSKRLISTEGGKGPLNNLLNRFVSPDKMAELKSLSFMKPAGDQLKSLFKSDRDLGIIMIVAPMTIATAFYLWSQQTNNMTRKDAPPTTMSNPGFMLPFPQAVSNIKNTSVQVLTPEAEPCESLSPEEDEQPCVTLCSESNDPEVEIMDKPCVLCIEDDNDVANLPVPGEVLKATATDNEANIEEIEEVEERRPRRRSRKSRKIVDEE